MKKIIIYTDKYSKFSELTRDWLKERKISFEEKDVSLDKNAQELFEKSKQYAVPVIVIDNEVILGFNEKKLNRKFKV